MGDTEIAIAQVRELLVVGVEAAQEPVVADHDVVDPGAVA